jgi:hypothetical protein
MSPSTEQALERARQLRKALLAASEELALFTGTLQRELELHEHESGEQEEAHRDDT